MSEEESRGEAQDTKPEDPNATINIKVGFKNNPHLFLFPVSPFLAGRGGTGGLFCSLNVLARRWIAERFGGRVEFGWTFAAC